MLYELAIMPDVFDRSSVGGNQESGLELRELLRELVIHGCVADLDKGEWARHVCSRLDGWSPALRTDVIKCLTRLHDLHRLVRHPRREGGHPTTDAEWLALALASHRRIPFDWIVVGHTPLADESLLNHVAELRRSEKWESRRRSASVRMCESEYRRYLSPLLRHAKRLEIVDPYLSFRSSRTFKIVELCASVMGERGHAPLPGEVYLHTWQGGIETVDSIQECLDAWTAKITRLKQRLRPRHSFKVVIWGKNEDGPPMHDRFLLTDQCGVLAGDSFNCWDEGTVRQTTWTLLDEQTCNERRNDFVRDISPYRWLDERVLK